MAFGRDPALVVAVGKPTPPGMDHPGQSVTPQDNNGQLTPEDEQTLQEGVSPEAADVLRRVLPPECQHIIEALGQEGEGEEMMEGEGGGQQDYGPGTGSGPPLPRPATRLGRM